MSDRVLYIQTPTLDKTPVGEAQASPDLSGYAQKAELPTKTSDLQNDSGFLTRTDVYEELSAKADKVSEVTVSTGGVVTQALEAGEWYHFTGALTSLTVTLTTPASGELAQYHFDFISGATAPTVTLPGSVVMPNGFDVEANKRYEVDILNNYGAVMAWANS